MKQVFLEVKESLLKRKVFSVLILVQVLLLFALISSLFLHFSNINTKTKSYYAQYKNMSIYQLSDELIGDREEEYFSDVSELDNLKSFYKNLQESNDFNYLNTTLQPVGIVNFKGNDIHLYGYEDGATMPFYEKEKDIYQVVKSIQVNNKVFLTFNLDIDQGRKFSIEDFSYSKGKIVPIILGSDYQSIYNLGDQIDIDYIDTTMKGKVIGFLKPNTIIPVGNEIEFSIDRYVILPEFIFEQNPVDNHDLLLQQRHYLHVINGQIFTNKDQLEIKSLINDISQKTNFKDLTIIGANGLGIDLMFSMMQQNKGLLIMLTSLLFIFCILSISLSLIMKWSINIKKYAIHLISGATISRIFYYTFVEIFLIIFLSLIIIFVFMRTVGVIPIYYYFLMILLGIAITFLGLLPFYIKLKNFDISKMLKRKE